MDEKSVTGEIIPCQINSHWSEPQETFLFYLLFNFTGGILVHWQGALEVGVGGLGGGGGIDKNERYEWRRIPQYSTFSGHNNDCHAGAILCYLVVFK